MQVTYLPPSSITKEIAKDIYLIKELVYPPGYKSDKLVQATRNLSPNTAVSQLQNEGGL